MTSVRFAPRRRAGFAAAGGDGGERGAEGARGNGADDMLLTSAGLWIASDTFGGAEQCGGLSGYAGICFLPYPA